MDLTDLNSTVRSPETFWTLQDALPLIKGLQSQVRRFGYHLCLGGGVLNNGFSKKDLDLFFLPLDNGDTCDPAKLKWFLGEMWGEGGDMRKRKQGRTLVRAVRRPDGTVDVTPVEEDGDYPTPEGSPYTDKLIYSYSGLRIDVFILGMREGVQEGEAQPEADPISQAMLDRERERDTGSAFWPGTTIPVPPSRITFSDWMRTHAAATGRAQAQRFVAARRLLDEAGPSTSW